MRIGILTGNDKLEYSSIDHFIEKIEESFQRLGCEIKRYGIVEDNNQLNERVAEHPDFTISFGTFFANIIGMQDLNIPVLQVVRQYLQTRGFQLDENGVRFVFMAVNAYIRSYKRKKIIEAIEEEHIHFLAGSQIKNC